MLHSCDNSLIDGCRIEILLVRKNFNFMLWSWRSECHIVLSKNNNSWPLWFIFLSNSFNQVSKIVFCYHDTQQALFSYWHAWSNNITSGVSVSPTIFAQRDIYSHIFSFLPPSILDLFKFLFSVVWRKRPLSSMLNLSHGLLLSKSG